jgi:hypothetical protein
MLVHDGDAGMLGFERRRKPLLLTTDYHHTCIGLVHARKEFYAGALTSAVFSEKSKDFPSPELNGDVGYGDSAPEYLRNAGKRCGNVPATWC